jgi:voltage-gated potassium channel
MPPLSRHVLAPGRFRLLLLSLLLFIIGTAVAPSFGGRILEFVLLATTLAVAILELHVPGQRRVVPFALAVSVIVASLMDLAMPMTLRHLPVIASAVVGVFAGFVVWLAYGSVMRPYRPVGDRIVGAICVYLLIGLAWASVYETLESVAPASFRFPVDTAWMTPGVQRYHYFSFVTLATLGYGDITPISRLAGTLASLEAVSGQLYIGITVARLVALSLADRSGSGGRSKSDV